MIEMTVAGIALDAANRAPIVLLRDTTERRALPIWIGQDQAKAIIAVLEDQSPPRPLTHDLLLQMVQAWDMEVDRIIIHTLQDSTFFAVIKIRNGEEVRDFDARPSDAIALALRADAPIWVMEEVVAEASIPVNHEADEEEREEFRRFLEDLSPADFLQRREESTNE
ncbi:MAG: bifunctional nuclease family protein [Prochlorothrix sp.]|nr:bifunctional nuclease family protein [Prochlorothrix sp.]